MRVADLVKFTGHSVLAHRMRALLTALGIAVGVAAVVLLTSIGEGVSREEAARLAAQLPADAFALAERSQRRLVQNLTREIVEELGGTARYAAEVHSDRAFARFAEQGE